jgi:hypothetical protein
MCGSGWIPSNMIGQYICINERAMRCQIASRQADAMLFKPSPAAKAKPLPAFIYWLISMMAKLARAITNGRDLRRAANWTKKKIMATLQGKLAGDIVLG